MGCASEPLLIRYHSQAATGATIEFLIDEQVVFAGDIGSPAQSCDEDSKFKCIVWATQELVLAIPRDNLGRDTWSYKGVDFHRIVRPSSASSSGVSVITSTESGSAVSYTFIYSEMEGVVAFSLTLNDEIAGFWVVEDTPGLLAD
jgi:hypothetical protein